MNGVINVLKPPKMTSHDVVSTVRKSLNIKKKDQVILPSFTIISCILPIIRCGAVPILVDSDPVTWNMDVKKIEDIINRAIEEFAVAENYDLILYQNAAFTTDEVNISNKIISKIEELSP